MIGHCSLFIHDQQKRAYEEARQKAEIDLDNWPDNDLDRTLRWPPDLKHRKRNRDVVAILCAGLSIAIVLLWLGIGYGSISRSTVTPQAQTIIR